MDYYDDNDNQADENEQNGGSPLKTAKPVNNMALASMICGIIGTLALCCCVAFPISIILGVAAITLAILSKKNQSFSGYAVAGLVFGILSLILGVAECVYIIAINYMLQDPNIAPIFDQILEQYNMPEMP